MKCAECGKELIEDKDIFVIGDRQLPTCEECNL